MSNFETICQADIGHLWTPHHNLLNYLCIGYDNMDEDCSYWNEYMIWNSDIYPNFLQVAADMGVAFIWEYELTEDYSYFAYNFPTIDKPNQLLQYKKDGKRKGIPRITKKKVKELEEISAANWLLHTIGVKPNGTN